MVFTYSELLNGRQIRTKLGAILHAVSLATFAAYSVSKAIWITLVNVSSSSLSLKKALRAASLCTEQINLVLDASSSGIP